MKILVLDTNRRDITSLFYHYCKLGHEVFYPTPFSIEEMNWDKVVLWPVLLTWAAEDPSKTNFHYHKFDEWKEFPYGEDNFLILEDFVEPIADKSVKVKLVDLRKENDFFDAVHVTPAWCSGDSLNLAEKIIDLYCPSAKVINSAFDPGSFNIMDNRTGDNCCEFLPAGYEGHTSRLGWENTVGFFRHPHEIKVLGIDAQKEKQKESWKDQIEFSSFLHNFRVRHHHTIIDAFDVASVRIKASHGGVVTNYGGNIRGQGADLRYSGENGITGNLITLSPRASILKHFSSRAIVHLKNDDWAGGVEISCRATGVPMLVSPDYYVVSGLKSTFGLTGRQGSAISVSTSSEVYEALVWLTDDENCRKTRAAVELIHDKVFTPEYWSSWRTFLENLVDDRV